MSNSTPEAAVPMDAALFGPDHRCFGCSQHNPIGMQLKYRVEGQEVVTDYLPSEHFEGPPGIMHGGLQATLVDDLAAWTVVGLRNRMGFTSSLQVRLLRPVRIGISVEARGRILNESDRAITVAVTVSQSGQVALTGRVVYALPDAEAAEKVLGRELPDEWKRLCRTPSSAPEPTEESS